MRFSEDGVWRSAIPGEARLGINRAPQAGETIDSKPLLLDSSLVHNE
jgi:hypothetical protein